MLKERVLTALFLLPVIVWIVLFAGNIIFQVTLVSLVLLAAWEWGRLVAIVRVTQRVIYVSTIAMLGFLAQLFLQWPFALTSIMWLLLLIPIIKYPAWQFCWSNRSFLRILGGLVIIPFWLALVHLYRVGDGAMLLMYLLILIWGADIGAYFSGRRWGRRKLLVKVSPGKTVAGLCGGVAFALLISIVAGIVFSVPKVDRASWLWAALIAVLASVVGDLLISVLKRQRHQKDSGQLLPGHGGLLDRLDSLCAAAPVFVWLLPTV